MATPYKPNTRFKPWKIKIGDLVLVEAGFFSSEYHGQFTPAVLIGVDSAQLGTGIARFLSPEHGKFGLYVRLEGECVIIQKANRNDFKRIPPEEQT